MSSTGETVARGSDASDPGPGRGMTARTMKTRSELRWWYTRVLHAGSLDDEFFQKVRLESRPGFTAGPEARGAEQPEQRPHLPQPSRSSSPGSDTRQTIVKPENKVRELEKQQVTILATPLPEE